MYGKQTWLIPDGYLPDVSSGAYVSHEAVCVVNVGNDEARIELTIFFEDAAPMEGFTAICGGRRTNHIRLDKITNSDGLKIPVGRPYAILVQSNTPIVVQHSRMDTSQAELTLMTTIGYGV